MDRLAYNITVHGVVQGVGFRYFTRQEAGRLGVYGTVKNKANGTVVIRVEGGAPQLKTFLSWCHHGPDTAHVDKLVYEQVELANFTSFEILR